jgi:uncharacterized Fe-S cluster-containing radical SAM superfamily enzyme
MKMDQKQTIGSNENMDAFSEMYDKIIEGYSCGVINVDTTHRCLLQCPFCLRQSEEYGKSMISDYRKSYGDLKPNELKKIIGFMKHGISFCGQISDPIYHKDFILLLESIEDATNVDKIEIHTNGSGKKQEYWDKLVDVAWQLPTKVEWHFGIDGIDEKSAIHRVGQDFHSAFGAMKYVASRQKKEPWAERWRVIWQYIPFAYNEHDILKAKEIADEIGVELSILTSGRFTPNSPVAPPKNMNLISDKIYSEKKEI